MPLLESNGAYNVLVFRDSAFILGIAVAAEAAENFTGFFVPSGLDQPSRRLWQERYANLEEFSVDLCAKAEIRTYNEY